MSGSPITHSIAIVAYPGVQMSAVLGLSDLFMIANDNSQRLGNQLLGSPRSDAPQLSVSEVSMQAMPSPALTTFDAIILPPNLTKSRGKNDFILHEWLRAYHASGTIMCSVCAGAFWLGHSGLLKGRPVTTHWGVAQEFQTVFPATRVNADHLLIDDNDIVTAGGLMAWLDLGLFIVNRWLGPQVVSETARDLLIDPNGREQRNYRSFHPPLNHGDSKILSLQHWLEANAATDINIQKMAARTQMSSRTFLRRFSAATGYKPSTYVQNLRIEKARGLLERSRIPVSEIGWKVGYHDPSAFSRLFRATTGLTAGEYRKRFGIRVQSVPSTKSQLI